MEDVAAASAAESPKSAPGEQHQPFWAKLRLELDDVINSVRDRAAQLGILFDLGFSHAVAARYVDGRRPLEQIIDLLGADAGGAVPTNVTFVGSIVLAICAGCIQGSQEKRLRREDKLSGARAGWHASRGGRGQARAAENRRAVKTKDARMRKCRGIFEGRACVYGVRSLWCLWYP